MGQDSDDMPEHPVRSEKDLEFWCSMVSSQISEWIEPEIEREIYRAVHYFITTDDPDGTLSYLVYPGSPHDDSPERGLFLRLLIDGRGFPNVTRDFDLRDMLRFELEGGLCNGSLYAESEGFLSALATELESMAAEVRAFIQRSAAPKVKT